MPSTKQTNAPTANGNGADHVANTASEIIQKSVEKLNEVVQPAQDQLISGAKSAADVIATAACKADTLVGIAGERVYDFQVRSTENIRNNVRRMPLTSLGIAATVGFAISLLLRAR